MVGFLLTLLTAGVRRPAVVVPVAVVIGILRWCVIVLATVKAANGEDYRYPR